ncbi:MAG: hypothetical protein NT062_01745, partial [Proteobacteria bacterium]|nr:hypothetical protein [Pseudomonadota bacterium]
MADFLAVGPTNLVAQLKAIRDARMRTAALVASLAQGDPAAWVAAFAQVIDRSHTHDDADALEALECITHAVADPALSYAARQELYSAAVTGGHGPIARLFLTASPRAIRPEVLEKQLAAERPLIPTGRPLTLGERKSLARTHDRQRLIMMLRDPHPAVVAILLDNPHVTEADVVKIASLRPAVPEALARVAAHVRWSLRHMIKRALVFNPVTPLADAIR